VPKALGDDLGLHAGLEQLGGVRMAQVVKAALDLLLLLEAPPDAVEFEGHQGPSLGAASTRAGSVQPGSRRRRFLACSARWARRASTTNAGRVMRRRLLVVFGSLKCSSP